MRTDRRLQSWLVVAVGVSLCAMLGVAWKHLQPPAPAMNDRAAVDEEPQGAAAVRPPTPPEDYVGSQACARCHAEIYESYQSQPMSYSAGWVPGDHEIEDFGDKARFQPPRGGCRYLVERKDDQVIHHEIMADAEGEIFDDARVVSLFIGSGTRGKTYGIIHGDRLFESPISWYSFDGGRWDLSPGYPPGRHARFERPFTDECLMCHVGRMAPTRTSEDTFVEPVVLEAGIGCERCHGPGAGHVARHESQGNPALDAIVNPANLDPQQRESICNQCHLHGKHSVPRYGRSVYDFRPGQRLGDVISVLVEGTGVRDDSTTKAVSQVQQMRASACFQGSEGRFGCTSCHDPHSKPEPEQVASFYRARCLECHTQQGCSLSAAERSAPPAEDSCIHCHMPRLATNDIPHASQTDHRVARRPVAEMENSMKPAGEWELFDDDESRMEKWEVDRAKGIGLAKRSTEGARGSPIFARRSKTMLVSSLRSAPDDVPVLRTLAYLALGEGDAAGARDYAQRALEVAPRDARALKLLVSAYHRLGNVEAGIDASRRLLTIDPWTAMDHVALAQALFQAGRTEEALEAAEKALELDPTLTEPRVWMVQGYLQSGNRSESRKQSELLRRMRAVQ
jgi:predicted CXXCH cytochrome family protein